MSRLVISALAVGLLSMTMVAQAEEAAHAAAKPAEFNVEEKAATCAACHGKGGVSTQAMFPTLAGQHKSYLINALHAYQSGARKNPVMGSQAATLSKAEIEALAEYFSQQPGPLYTPALK